MAENDEIVIDVTGQPNGPSPAEQAMVDAEQKALIEQIKAERAPAEAEEARIRNERIQRALDEQAERRSFAARLDAIEARLDVMERK